MLKITNRVRDATGERSVSLAKGVMYYITHLAEHLNSKNGQQGHNSDGIMNDSLKHQWV